MTGVKVTVNFTTGAIRVDEPDTEDEPIECLWCRSRNDLVFSISQQAFVCFGRDACDSRVQARLTG